MVETDYHVIFKGEIAEGEDIENVKKRLASLFKIDISKVESFFSSSPVIIKKHVDYKTSIKFKKVFEKTGAHVNIVPAHNRETHQKSTLSAKKSQKEAIGNNKNLTLNGKPAVISPKFGPSSLIYTPLPGNHIEGCTNGINFKRQYINKVSFDQILLVSVFKQIDAGEEKLLILIFIKGHTRPIIVNADAIRYTDFPSVSGNNTVSSLRRFIIFLFNQNPSLKVDEFTYDFMLNVPPQVYEKNIATLSTALALEVEKDLRPVKERQNCHQTLLRLHS